MNAGTYNAYKNFLKALALDGDFTTEDFTNIRETLERFFPDLSLRSVVHDR